MEKLLELKNITAGYNGLPIISNVNLLIKSQDFIGIIGPNGGGKTTILKVILGLVKPIAGELIFHKKFKIGYLRQFSLIDKRFPITVADVVSSGLMENSTLFSKLRKNNIIKTNAMLEQMKITHLQHKTLNELSGGQLQRAFLARAIISEPELLLLDEPNTFVDKEFEKDLYSLLTELNKKIAIIMVSHDIGTISSYIKSIACVSSSLYFHDAKDIPETFIKTGECPVEIIMHGKVPHRVLHNHKNNE